MVDSLAPAGLISQTDSSAVETLAYSAVQHTEVTRVHVVNRNGEAALYRMWHADNGSSATAGNMVVAAVFSAVQSFAVPILANHNGSGLQVKPGGRLYVECTAGAVFSIYGTVRPAR